VSIGSATIDDQQYGNDQSQSGWPCCNMIAQGNSMIEDSSRNTQQIPKRRRLRDASARYRRLYSNSHKRQGQKISNFHYNDNQHTASHTQQTWDESRYGHLNYPPRKITVKNTVYPSDLEQKYSNHFCMQHFSLNSTNRIDGNDYTHTTSEERTTPTFPERRGIDVETMNQSAFNSDSQIHKEYDQSGDLQKARNQHMDRTQLKRQAGIKRFQKPKYDDRDLFSLPGEEDANNLFARASGLVDYGGLDDFSDHSLEGRESRKSSVANSNFQRKQQESQSSFLCPTESINFCGHDFDNTESELEQQSLASKPQLNRTIPVNPLTRRLSDITNEPNMLAESSLRSHGTGISRFKRSQGESVFNHDFTKPVSRYLQSSEETFEHDLNHQMKSSIGTLRFFDDENEVDATGTPLVSSPRLPKRQTLLDSIGKRWAKNCDYVNTLERPLIKTTAQQGSTNTGAAKLRTAPAFSTDTEYFRDDSFGDEFNWTFGI